MFVKQTIKVTYRTKIALQKLLFCNAKAALLQCESGSFAMQKHRFDLTKAQVLKNRNDFLGKQQHFYCFTILFQRFHSSFRIKHLYTDFNISRKKIRGSRNQTKPNQGIKYVITKTLEVYSFAFLLFFLTLWHVSENGTQNL